VSPQIGQLFSTLDFKG
jgi:hypothetical protein